MRSLSFPAPGLLLLTLLDTSQCAGALQLCKARKLDLVGATAGYLPFEAVCHIDHHG